METEKNYAQLEKETYNEDATLPWKVVGMGISPFKGQNYFLLVDYRSHYYKNCLLLVSIKES